MLFRSDRYFNRQLKENPSYYFATQLDCEELITNIFWADARMIIDYSYFGDVITFDTTYSTNKDARPLGVFLGLNHHRETMYLEVHFYTMKQLNLLYGYLRPF